jgi:hypothetical protein
MPSVASGEPRAWMGPGRSNESGGSASDADIPSRRHRRRSRLGDRSPRRVLYPNPCPWAALDEPADATEYPFRPHPSCGQDNQRRAVRMLLGAVNSDHLRHAKVLAIYRSLGITCESRQIPKFAIKHRCLRQASLRDGSKTRPGIMGSSGERVSHRVGTGGVAGRRDGIPAPRPSRPAAGYTSRVPLACHYHRSTTVNSEAL